MPVSCLNESALVACLEAGCQSKYSPKSKYGSCCPAPKWLSPNTCLLQEWTCWNFITERAGTKKWKWRKEESPLTLGAFQHWGRNPLIGWKGCNWTSSHYTRVAGWRDWVNVNGWRVGMDWLANEWILNQKRKCNFLCIHEVLRNFQSLEA